MPDIFLSYSRQDLAIAGQMAAALQAARAGNRAASDRALVQFHAVDAELKYVWLTAIHAQRGETALALDAIEAALRASEVEIVSIAQEAAYDPIRKEPRFKAVRDAIIPPDLFVPPKALRRA